jgi:hypothetical protein
MSKPRPFIVLVLVLSLVFHAIAFSQLPPRPAPGEVEEPVDEKLALKLDDLFEAYTANFRLINRFVGVASLDRTYRIPGEPLHVDLMWFIHAQDFSGHVRRMDELTSTNGVLRSGIQTSAVMTRATIETEDDVLQFQTRNAVQNIRRDSFEKDEEFGRKFRVQTRLDFWELPFRGSDVVRIQGTLPSLNWRELPKVPALFQEGGHVTAWHEDLTQIQARVSFTPSGFAYDFTFSKKHASLPIRVVLSRNDERVRGVTDVVDTQWFAHSAKEFPQPVYLPVRVNCEFDSPEPGRHDTHELQIRWLVGKDVSKLNFSQDPELFMTSAEIKEAVLVNALNKD